MARRAFVVLAGALLATRGAAHADPALVDARAALASSDYPGAQTALDRSIASGTLGPDELAEVYQLRGIVAAARGDATTAKLEFAHLLAIHPAATLPAGTSPKITKPFTAAGLAAVEHAPLHVTVEPTSERVDAPPNVRIEIVGDALDMIAGARVTVVADGQAAPPRTVTRRAGDALIVIELPRAQQLEVQVAAVDEHGNRVVELTTASAPIALHGWQKDDGMRARPHDADDDRVAAHRPIYLQWWWYGGVSVAALGVASVAALEGRSAAHEADAILADSSHHTYAESTTVESRANRDFTIANVSFVAAGAFAIATGVIYAVGTRHAHADEHARRGPTIAPTPMRGGGGFALEVPF